MAWISLKSSDGGPAGVDIALSFTTAGAAPVTPAGYPAGPVTPAGAPMSGAPTSPAGTGSVSFAAETVSPPGGYPMPAPSVTWTWTAPTNLADGAHTIAFQGVDSYGDVASVIVHSAVYHEYLHLVRTADGWRVANALWRPS